ncbi:unnamed protein product [Menidia menidia]|uniref:(Atlantic silverside) hypothetical protein n=1 Tax=Menidia menidia TaxID=238744 RepID=A0A8S4ARV4_9TELE|nr:unnamed protein product [Menidia menidia]
MYFLPDECRMVKCERLNEIADLGSARGTLEKRCVHLLVVVARGVTSTWTAIFCCPAEHQYHAVSLICSFLKVTENVPDLSSLMASEESS